MFVYNGDKPQISSRQTDTDCDGTPDMQCVEFTFNEAGFVVANKSDDDCDGVPESCFTSTVDDNGLPLEVEYDRDCDGEVDDCVTNEFECV